MKFGKIIVWNSYDIHDFSSKKYNFFIGKTSKGNILSNPFGIGGKRKNLKKMTFPTREEALEAYSEYFDMMYSINATFKRNIDYLCQLVENGNDIYLQCFCHPLKCHGDIIAEKISKKIIKHNSQKSYKQNGNK